MPLVPLEQVLPEIPPVRLRYVAGMGNDGDAPVYSIHAVTEMYDRDTGTTLGRMAVVTVLDGLTDDQARHLSLQLARATGLSAEHDIALGILQAQLRDAQDALKAITAMLGAADRGE